MEADSERKEEVTFDLLPARPPMGGKIAPSGAAHPMAEGVVLFQRCVFCGISETRKTGAPPHPPI